MKEDFKELITSNNYVEIEQILFVLSHHGIDAIPIGLKGLEIGSVEMMGIRGASIFIHSDDFDEAQKVLISMGLSFDEKEEDKDIVNYMYWLLAGLLVGAIIYMVVITYF
ncbi:MAG TPA: hypothetical protein PKC30_05210 [Saprospiraceae bacterium]|nr:hypothetical protein [Saprospiraceae bacterium]